MSWAAQTSKGEGWTGISTRSLAAMADFAKAFARGGPSMTVQSYGRPSAATSRCSVGLGSPITGNPAASWRWAFQSRAEP